MRPALRSGGLLFAMFIASYLCATAPAHGQKRAQIALLAELGPTFPPTGGSAASNAGAVVGSSYLNANDYRPVLWRSAANPLDVGWGAPGSEGTASGLSADASVVVGESYPPSSERTRAFVWRAGTGYRHLRTPNAELSAAAYAVTPDGATIVGAAWNGIDDPDVAVRWSRSGDPSVVTADPDLDYLALDVTPDASAILLMSRPARGRGAIRAARWTKQNGTTDLGAFHPRAISADGRTVVGDARDGEEWRATVWRPSSGVVFLRHSQGGTMSMARGVSGDGRTIFGIQIVDGVAQATLWIDGEPSSLRDYLVAGFDLEAEEWPSLLSAEAVSDDGRVIVGRGTYKGETRAFRVVVPNAPPIANAGRNVVAEVRRDRPVRVRLDGSKSRDQEKHALAFRWTGRKIRFDDPTATKPVAAFPLGRTVVTLRVTDELGARAVDTVAVTVRVANSRVHPQGDAANEWFAHASESAGRAARSAEPNAAALEGLACASAADAVGEALGDLVVWGGSESVEEATLRYAEWRAVQLAYGNAAAVRLAEASAQLGDDALLDAAAAARRGAIHAARDLCDE